MSTSRAIPLVEMRDVRVKFDLGHGQSVRAVDGISLDIGQGEIVGLIGESGSGKSTLGRAMLGLVKSSGEVRWKGRLLSDMSPAERHASRTRMQMVFQDPHSALDPRRTILKSVREPLDITKTVPKAERDSVAMQMLTKVGLNEAHASRYPHQLSGGQKQRVNIARALVTEPELIVCDESVAALDVALQAEILNLLQDLREELGLSILFISHDLAVVSYISDRVAVMYLGSMVEASDAEKIVQRPLHPYAEALISAQPKPVPSHARTSLPIVLKGEIPSPVNPPQGCRFHTRCNYARAQCSEETPVSSRPEPGREVFCHFAQSLQLAGVPALDSTGGRTSLEGIYGS